MFNLMKYPLLNTDMLAWHFQHHLALHMILVAVDVQDIHHKDWSYLVGEEQQQTQVVHHIAVAVHRIAVAGVVVVRRTAVAGVEVVHRNVHHPCVAAGGVVAVGCALAAVAGGDVAAP